MNKKNIYIFIAFVTIINAFNLKNTWAQCTVNPHDFQYSMTITGELIIDGTSSTDVNDSVFTYVNGECRGSAPVMYNSSVDRYIVLLTVFSNNVSGENVEIKIRDASSDKVFESTNTLIFQSDENLGTVSNPYKITCSLLSGIEDNKITGKRNIAVYPNPSSGKVNFNYSGKNVNGITILDMTGKIIFEKYAPKQNEPLDISSLKEGVYMVLFRTDKEVLSTKIVKE